MDKPPGSLRQRISRLFEQRDRVTVRDLVAVTKTSAERQSTTSMWYNLRVCLALEEGTPEMAEALDCMKRTL